MDQLPISSSFVIESASRRLMLRHPDVTAEWQWDENGRIVATRLAHTPSGVEWIQQDFPCQLYLPAENGESFDYSTRLRGPAHRDLEPPRVEIDPDGRTRAIWQTRPLHGSLSYKWQIEAFPGHPAIRQWVEITNEGTDTAVLSKLPVFHWVFDAFWGNLTAYHGLERHDTGNARNGRTGSPGRPKSSKPVKLQTSPPVIGRKQPGWRLPPLTTVQGSSSAGRATPKRSAGTAISSATAGSCSIARSSRSIRSDLVRP